MIWRDRSEINPDILLGHPVVKGTRFVGGADLLQRFAVGISETKILGELPFPDS